MTEIISFDKPIFYFEERKPEFQEWRKVLEWLEEIERLKSRFKWRC